MNDESNPNNIENDGFTTTEDSDFKNLIIRLKDIRKTIAFLENKYLDRF
tara:strand:+ start:301 stop:447 length:147 start_codon:yes stop_codon:yes gene_type:complete